jgi:hypothetical protein
MTQASSFSLPVGSVSRFLSGPLLGPVGVGLGFFLSLTVAFHGDAPPGLAELNRLHAICLVTAWFALWLPSLRGRSISFADLLGCGLVVALVAYCGLHSHAGEVREASYHWLILTLDGALLFFAASRLNSRLGALPVWLLLNGLAVVGPLLVRSGHAYASQQTFGNLIWVAVAPWLLGGLLWAIGLILEGSRISSRGGAFVLCLLALTGAIGARHLGWKKAGAATQRQNETAVFWQNMDLVAAGLLRSDALMGAGPGALSALLARQEGALNAARRTEQSEPQSEESSGGDGNTDRARKAAREKASEAGAPGFFSLLRPWNTAPAQSWKMYVVEWGAVGTALGLALMALLLGRACFASLWGNGPVFASTQVVASLCLWFWLIVEGVWGPALRHPYGVILFCMFSGLVWGETRRALHGDAGETSLFERSTLVRRLTLSGGGALCLVGLCLTLLPLWGTRRAERIADANLALPSAASSLRWAARLHPWSADICLKQAKQLIAQSKADGKADDLDLYNAEERLSAALDRNPYRDDLYAARAELYRDEHQSLKMLQTISDGLRHCPNSLTLSQLAIEYAQLANDDALLEIACRDAIRLASPGSETRVRQLGRLAALYERKGNYTRALKIAVQQVQEDPSNPDALTRMRRLAGLVHSPPSLP